MIIIVCVNTIDLVDDIIVFNLASFTFVLSITFKALPKNYIKIIRTIRWHRKNANKRVHKVRLAKENIWRRELSPCTTQTNTELVSHTHKKKKIRRPCPEFAVVSIDGNTNKKYSCF